MLRVVDREKVEIHVGNNVSGGWRCCRRIDTSVASAKHQQQEHGGKKKTDVQTSVIHEDSLSATTNNRHLPKFRRALSHF
jgi:hypothetical protein